MRRDIGAVLVGLGVLFLVIALAVPVFVSSHVLKFPLNYYYSATLVSPNTTYFDASTLSEVTGANVEAIYTWKGDAAAGNSSTAVWDVFNVLRDTSTGKQIQIQTFRAAFDRRSAALVNCCGQNVNGKPVTDVGGIAGFTFPIGTAQQTYDVFDTTLQKAAPFSYVGTDTVNGISTYKFNEYLFPTNIGFSPLSATEPLFYGINLTYWIDPDTGVLLKVLEHQQLFLEDPNSGAVTTTLFDGTLSPTAASVAGIVAIDGSGRLKLTVVHLIIPLVAALLGLALLVWGALLFRRGNRPQASESSYEAMTRELAGQAQDNGPASRSAGGGRHAAGSSRPDSPDSIVPGLDGDPAPTAADHAATTADQAATTADQAATVAEHPGGEDPEPGAAPDAG